MGEIQSTSDIWTHRHSLDRYQIHQVAVDFPVLEIDSGRGAGEEIVERTLNLERDLFGNRNAYASTDSHVRVIAPVHLDTEPRRHLCVPPPWRQDETQTRQQYPQHD